MTPFRQRRKGVNITTRTENYQLPQWAANDPVKREDFNQAMANIEEGLDGIQAAADAAKDAAGAAQRAADAAQASRPYVIGTYTGNGGTQIITVGFRPSAVLACGADTSSSASTQGGYIMLTQGNIIPERLAFTDTGFTVKHNSESYPFPSVNANNIRYAYLALK